MRRKIVIHVSEEYFRKNLFWECPRPVRAAFNDTPPHGTLEITMDENNIELKKEAANG